MVDIVMRNNYRRTEDHTRPCSICNSCCQTSVDGCSRSLYVRSCIFVARQHTAMQTRYWSTSSGRHAHRTM